jgi:hypothetical protein
MCELAGVSRASFYRHWEKLELSIRRPEMIAVCVTKDVAGADDVLTHRKPIGLSSPASKHFNPSNISSTLGESRQLKLRKSRVPRIRERALILSEQKVVESKISPVKIWVRYRWVLALVFLGFDGVQAHSRGNPGRIILILPTFATCAFHLVGVNTQDSVFVPIKISFSHRR